MRAWLVVSMLFVLMAINYLDKVVLGLVAAPLMHELHLSAAQYGTLAGSFFLLFGITGVIGGFVANRVPCRWLLLGMSVLWALAQLPVIYGSTLGALIASRLLLGAGEGPAQPVAIHASYKWFKDEQRNLSVTVFQQGAVCGTVAAGFLVPFVNERFGWRANFLVLGALGLVWSLLWLCVGREGPLAAELPGTGPDAPAASVTRHIRYRVLLTDTTIAFTIALHFASYLLLSLTVTWLPAYLNQGLGYAPRLAGQLFSAIVVFCAPVGLVLAAWSQRMMTRGVPSRVARGRFICGCLGSAGLLLVALTTLALAPAVKVALIGLAVSTMPVISALGPAMIAEIVPSAQRGAVLGIEYSVAWLAGVIAPPAVGWMIRAADNSIAVGFEHGLLVVGVLLVAITLAASAALNPERSAIKMTRHTPV